MQQQYPNWYETERCPYCSEVHPHQTALDRREYTEHLVRCEAVFRAHVRLAILRANEIPLDVPAVCVVNAEARAELEVERWREASNV